MHLIKAFIESLHVAIRLYENRFEKDKKDIPEHRIFDLIELRALLNDTEYTIQETYELLQSTMKRMKTGWISDGKEIIGTGRSHLKDHLNQVLNRPSYTLENLLKEQAKATKEKMQSKQKEPMTEDTEYELLREKLQIQQYIIEEQAKQLEFLQKDKQSLQQEVTNLKALLATLQQANLQRSENPKPSHNPFDEGFSENPKPSNNPFDEGINAPPAGPSGAYSHFFTDPR